MTFTALDGASFGDRLIAARGDMHLEHAATHVCDLLPRSLWISREKLRRMEVGRITEDEASPVLIAALAKVYGVPIAALSERAAGAIGRLRLLLTDEHDGGPTLPEGVTRTEARNPTRLAPKVAHSGRAERPAPAAADLAAAS